MKVLTQYDSAVNTKGLNNTARALKGNSKPYWGQYTKTRTPDARTRENRKPMMYVLGAAKQTGGCENTHGVDEVGLA